MFAVSFKAAGGVLLLLLAFSQMGEGLAIKPLISVYVWGGLAVLLMVAAKRFRMEGLQLVSMVMWVGVSSYWFATTWDAPRGEWFGIYIPFLNGAAFAWIILAALGFWYSLSSSFAALKEEGRRFLSCLFAVASHLIVGGLLTLQIGNIFEEYDLNSFWDLNLTLSVSWGVYALLLFLWGASSKQRLFRYFGSVVLALVSIKIFFFDLSGEDSIYKVLVLLLMALISFTISYINHRWKSEPAASPASDGTEYPEDDPFPPANVENTSGEATAVE
ncbi:hypothetical protein D3C75_729240 [compost metagenome]